MDRTKKLSEARVVAEQEINKFRKEFEERYLKESELVITNFVDTSYIEKEREWLTVEAWRPSKGRHQENWKWLSD